MSKQVLIEYFSFQPSPQSLREAKVNPSKNLIVQGVVQRADAKNQNGRVYPKEVLEREVEKYIAGPIAENRALGELDHPDSSIINLKNVCHNIKKIWWDGDDLMGRIEILPTPSGNILKELFLNNITVGISSRGMGSVKPLGEGTVEVQDDFELLCWDFVSTPSTQGAFMKPTALSEGLNSKTTKYNKYSKINKLISEIICSQTGVCCVR
jgi:Prohead core protein serine protease